MPWYNGDYPPSYKNQPEFLREKAVEIANALLKEGVGEGIAIARGLKSAKQFFQDKEDENLKEISDDSDTLEPGDWAAQQGTIDTADPGQLSFWASRFKVSTEELKAAAAMRGSVLSEIKKYLET